MQIQIKHHPLTFLTPNPKMKLRFLPLFMFLLISCTTQALSTSDFIVNITSQSQGRGLSNGTGPAQELHGGKLYGNGSIKDDAIRLKYKVEERKYEHKHELSNTSRKAQGGRGGSHGGAGANVNHRPPRSQNSAPSLLSVPHFWASTLVLYVSFALIFLFPFH